MLTVATEYRAVVAEPDVFQAAQAERAEQGVDAAGGGEQVRPDERGHDRRDQGRGQQDDAEHLADLGAAEQHVREQQADRVLDDHDHRRVQHGVPQGVAHVGLVGHGLVLVQADEVGDRTAEAVGEAEVDALGQRIQHEDAVHDDRGEQESGHGGAPAVDHEDPSSRDGPR
jgi:hypothetical protein